MEFEIKDTDQGEFNSGLAIIYRLDTIHKYLHIARANDDYDLIYKHLKSFFAEIIRGLYKQDKIIAEQKEKFKRIQQTYFKIRKLKNEGKPIPVDLVDTLYFWELELCTLEQDLGWGMQNKLDRRFSQ